MSAFDELVDALTRGRAWDGMNDNERAKDLMRRVYTERYHKLHEGRYRLRSNLQNDESIGAYAAWIIADNQPSGAFQGTAFTWFPGEGGSVAQLGIGTEGWGPDQHILGRPGHRRRLKALSRLHRGKLWVKHDLLDNTTPVPTVVSSTWPGIPAALKSYDKVIYAAAAIRAPEDASIVADLLDLFFFEHGTEPTGRTAQRWKDRQTDIANELFPKVDELNVLATLRERRFVVLEGPPGTGKTRLAYNVAARIGSSSKIQFHPARTYEDFVVGLHPKPVANGLAFEVRAGDLLQANQRASKTEHVLVIDEINRADLGRVLGESIILFEVGETGRSVRLPYQVPGQPEELSLSPNLLVLGTRNTADRTIARVDLAIRRRFAFVEVWPDLRVIEQQNDEWAREIFHDVLMTFAEYADEDALRLVPGHSYLLDPRPDADPTGRHRRIVNRVRHELLPLLRDYLDERLGGSAIEAIVGLVDRLESRVLDA